MRALLALALAGLLLPACSLLGLDRLQQATCSDNVMGDAFCASLAVVHPTGDECLRWQCSGATGHCELEPTDLDSDNSPAMMCEPAGVAPDCDDGDPTNAPTIPETCDGSDDDCDGATDEGTVAGGSVVVLRELATTVSDIAFARAPDADVNLVATSNMATDSITVVTDAASASLATIPVVTAAGATIPARGLTAAEGLGGDRYALLVETLSTCRRIVLGIYDASEGTIVVDTAHAVVGFPNVEGDCALGATSTGGMARDAVSGDLLVAYLETVRRDCAAAAPAPVLVIGAPDAAPAAAAVTPLMLGESVDPRPPAVLAIGAHVFLVAFPVASGAIEVHRVTLAASGAVMSPELVFTEAAGTAMRADVRLTAGPTADGHMTLALTYSEGCGSSPVSIRFLDSDGTTITAGTRVSGMAAAGARFPFAVHQPVLHEWLLGWRASTGLRGLRVASEGSMRLGDDFALTDETTGFEVSLALFTPARSSTAAYRALTVHTDGATTSTVAAELGCVAPPVSP